MFLLVLFLVSQVLNSSQEPTSSPIVVYADAARSSSPSNDELCDIALAAFMKRTDSDLAQYIKPHLVTVIKEATTSPDSDDGIASPTKTVKKWLMSPDTINSSPKQELDEVVLRAVQKAFQEKEKDFKNMATQVEGMFSKKSTGIITAVATILVTLASSLSSVYATLDSVGNCTK